MKKDYYITRENHSYVLRKSANRALAQKGLAPANDQICIASTISLIQRMAEKFAPNNVDYSEVMTEVEDELLVTA